MKKIIAALLLFTVVTHAQVIPADGFWRTSDDPAIGSGLLITTQGEITLVSVFTYDEEGNNAWYITSGQVDENGLFEADLYQTIGGTNIVAESPQSATSVNTGERIKIQFSGNQMGELTVGNSVNKSIQPFHFGVENWQTEHQTLADGTFYSLPELDGVWLVGATNSDSTWVLDLHYDPILSDGWLTAPYQGKVYLSEHPSSRNMAVTCPWKVNSMTDPVLTPFCTVYSENFEEVLFTINYSELGVETMWLRDMADNTSVSYKAFKVESQSQVHSGHWRTHDDPDVGSGLYLITQGDVTLALLYSYDQDGSPEWGIAIGNIDEAGVFQAELLSPTEGKPLYIGTPESAILSGESQTLTLQFQGAEVGSISIDGSEPKSMQRFNYGVELFETEQITFNQQPLKYPGQLAGKWFAYDESFPFSLYYELEAYYPNYTLDPPNPLWDEANGYKAIYSDLYFICPKVRPYEQAYCSGESNRGGDLFPFKLYFEDIGAYHFKLYVGDTSTEVAEIDRSYPVIHFFRTN